MGPTKVFQAKLSHPNSIRGKYGLTDTRNVTHGSGITYSSIILAFTATVRVFCV